MKTDFNNEKPITWSDIENSLNESIKNGNGDTDAEKLEYFRNKILGHLDNLQKDENKKIIQFPKSAKNI